MSEMLRDKFIFFIFLSVLIHFSIFSFYITSNEESPPFEIIEILNNKEPQITKADNSRLVEEIVYNKNYSNQNTKKSTKILKENNGTTFLLETLRRSSKDTLDIHNLPRRHTVSTATKDPIYAEYVEEWRRKVEIIGNLYYPQDLALKKVSGDLLLDAAINKEGQIQDISILRSSGNVELDEAAINIVKLASPFKPLPEKITNETDILHITRTWKFSNK